MNIAKQQQALKMHMDKTQPMKCGGCKNNVFFRVVQLKYLSAFMTNTGQNQGAEIPMYVCANPACGIMYPGVMSDHEAKKFAKKDDVNRFSWASFFTGGMAVVNAMIEASKKTEKEKN